MERGRRLRVDPVQHAEEITRFWGKVVACDGVEALDLLFPPVGIAPLRPALVLMDVDMPHLGGIETVRRIRAEPSTRMLPVIMLTCSVADHDIVNSHDVGANGYVQKPLDIGDFLNVASALGTFWLTMHHTRGTPGRPHSPGCMGQSACPGASGA